MPPIILKCSPKGEGFHPSHVLEINGSDFIGEADNDIYTDAIEFYPDTGEEAPMGFFWELRHEIDTILTKQDKDDLLDWLYKDKKFGTADFNMEDIPEKLKYLVNDRRWFDKKIQKERDKHIKGKYCGGLSSFLEEFWSAKHLPPITTKPINFCPYCGVKLKEKFAKDNWYNLWKSETLIKDIGRKIFYVINGYYEDEEQ